MRLVPFLARVILKQCRLQHTSGIGKRGVHELAFAGVPSMQKR
jgi:hypothetical protein